MGVDPYRISVKNITEMASISSLKICFFMNSFFSLTYKPYIVIVKQLCARVYFYLKCFNYSKSMHVLLTCYIVYFTHLKRTQTQFEGECLISFPFSPHYTYKVLKTVSIRSVIYLARRNS